MTTSTPAVEVRDLRKSYRGGRRPCAASTSTSSAARPSPCSARTAPARARRSRSSRATATAPAARRSVLGVDPQRGGLDWKARLGIVLQSSGEQRQRDGARAADALRRLLPEPARRRRGDRRGRARGEGEDAHPQALGRPAPPGRCRARHHRPPRAAVPRRADDRLRPRGAPPVLGPHPQLKREGTTILLTTHYLDEAAQLGDRAGIIADGRLVDIGAIDEIGGADGARPDRALARERRARTRSAPSSPASWSPRLVAARASRERARGHPPEPRRHLPRAGRARARDRSTERPHDRRRDRTP